MSDDAFEHHSELLDAVEMRIAEFATEDLCEWFRELLHTTHAEAGFDGMALFFAHRAMRAMPLPEWTEDHL